MNTYSGLVGVLVLSAIVLPARANEQCSIHPPNGASDAQLSGLAKVSKSQAQAAALGAIPSNSSRSVQSAELEAEHGCLIWSFDVKLAGEPGVREVQVDAGTGKVLSVQRESASQEADEAVKEGPQRAD